MNAEPASDPLDVLDMGAETNVDPPRSGFRGEPTDEIGIELRQDAVMPLQHDHFCPGECRDVRQFSRNVPSADERNTPRQCIELQKIGACRQVFFARNAQTFRNGSRSDQNETCFEQVVSDLDCLRAAKMRAAMKGIDAVLREFLLTLFRYRIGKGPLECHELAPVERRLAPADAPAAHPPILVKHFRHADQHLLWIAAAQGAGSAKWQ